MPKPKSTEPPIRTALYVAISNICGEPFAYSYIGQGAEDGNDFIPKTHIAFERLRQRREAMETIAAQGMRLVDPWTFPGKGPSPPWRPASAETFATMNRREKIRELHLLANLARLTAARQAKRDSPDWDHNLTTARDVFHHWIGRAQEHERHADKLQGITREPLPWKDILKPKAMKTVGSHLVAFGSTEP